MQTIIASARAQEQALDQPQTQAPAVPAPPAPGATSTEVGAGQADPAARSSGWTDIDAWWVFILVLAVAAAFVIGTGAARRRLNRSSRRNP
jgi:hypothetical protein